ncbi:hypothetical protein BCS42_07115 [Crenothrix sp. D3]|nr:hypothetical protein BCS42_07115 [Crenothrix sp. D3]
MVFDNSTHGFNSSQFDSTVLFLVPKLHSSLGTRYTLFFNDIPEIGLLFDLQQMIKDGENFDFNELPAHIVERSWIPSYCKV